MAEQCARKTQNAMSVGPCVEKLGIERNNKYNTNNNNNKSSEKREEVEKSYEVTLPSYNNSLTLHPRLTAFYNRVFITCCFNSIYDFLDIFWSGYSKKAFKSDPPTNVECNM